MSLFPHSSSKPILAEGLPDYPRAPSLEIRERLRNEKTGNILRSFIFPALGFYIPASTAVYQAVGRTSKRRQESMLSGGQPLPAHCCLSSL